MNDWRDDYQMMLDDADEQAVEDEDDLTEDWEPEGDGWGYDDDELWLPFGDEEAA